MLIFGAAGGEPARVPAVFSGTSNPSLRNEGRELTSIGRPGYVLDRTVPVYSDLTALAA